MSTSARKKMHIKRAWHLLVLIGYSEVLDYLYHQITTLQVHAIGGSSVACPGGILKGSKFQNNQISYFAIFYSVMCISVLCFLHHRHSIWFYYPFCILLLLTPYCGYYCPQGGEKMPFPCNFTAHHCKTLLQSCKSVSHHCIWRCMAAKWPRTVAGSATFRRRPDSCLCCG